MFSTELRLEMFDRDFIFRSTNSRHLSNPKLSSTVYSGTRESLNTISIESLDPENITDYHIPTPHEDHSYTDKFVQMIPS